LDESLHVPIQLVKAKLHSLLIVCLQHCLDFGGHAGYVACADVPGQSLQGMCLPHCTFDIAAGDGLADARRD